MIYWSTVYGSFNSQTIHVFSIVGPIVYGVWIIHYIITLINLRKMVNYMERAIAGTS